MVGETDGGEIVWISVEARVWVEMMVEKMSECLRD